MADHMVVVVHQIRRQLEDLGYPVTVDGPGDEAGLDAADGNALPALSLVRDWAPDYDDDATSRATGTEETS